MGRAERLFAFELNWEVQTSSLPALYEDKQGTVGVKSDITHEQTNRRIRDPYVRWCERRSVSFRAHGRLLDCVLVLYLYCSLILFFLTY